MPVYVSILFVRCGKTSREIRGNFMLGCLSKIGPAGMVGFPHPEDDLLEKDTVYGRTDCPDSVGSRDGDHRSGGPPTWGSL